MSRLAPLTASAALSLALAVPLSGSLPAGSAAAAGPRPGATAFAAKTHALVNTQRTDYGRSALKQNACLKKSAQRQARRMADRRELSHQDLGAVLKKCGLRAAGENVAYGYGTPARTVAGWMASPGHRTNILSSTFRVAGVGAVKKRGVWYVAQVFGRRA